jgi:dTDP-4-amino-4,6-dideoxygalactose transaminase
MPNVKHNYAYFPIFVDEKKYGMSRDALYEKMKSANVFGRRYFYPLISSFSTYRGLESANLDNLPVANKIAEEVICLPIHHLLSEEDVERVLNCIRR